MASRAASRLQNDIREITQSPINGVLAELVDDNLFKWRIYFEGTPDTFFSQGVYEATMEFPESYPDAPPVFTIVSKFWHPNVYEDGKLCISVLHTTGEDPLNELETIEMRWLPSHNPASIIRCFLSILDSPGGAPANPDAQRQYNQDREGYNKQCLELAKEARTALTANVLKRIPHPDTDPNDPTYKARVHAQRRAVGLPEFTAEEKLALLAQENDMDGDDYNDDFNYEGDEGDDYGDYADDFGYEDGGEEDGTSSLASSAKNPLSKEDDE